MPVVAGAALVIGVVVIIRVLQGRSETVPTPEQPPPPETVIADAGLPGGT